MQERRHTLEHPQRPLAHGPHVVERLLGPQVGELAAFGPRRLVGVVHPHELGTQRLEPAASHREPEVLEGRDVPQVPDERAHQRVVDPVQVLLAQRRHQGERALADLVEQRLDPSRGRCLSICGRHGRVR